MFPPVARVNVLLSLNCLADDTQQHYEHQKRKPQSQGALHSARNRHKTVQRQTNLGWYILLVIGARIPLANNAIGNRSVRRSLKPCGLHL